MKTLCFLVLFFALIFASDAYLTMDVKMYESSLTYIDGNDYYYDTQYSGESCNNYQDCYSLVCSLSSSTGIVISYVSDWNGVPYNGETPINILLRDITKTQNSFVYKSNYDISVNFYTMESWASFMITQSTNGKNYTLHYPQC